MPDRDLVQARVRELAGRDWDLGSIEARYRTLLTEGISSRRHDPHALLACRAETLDRIQRRAEEYEYLTHS